MINSVVESRKKYLFAVVVTVALVTAVLVYLHPRDLGYLAAIIVLAILLGMLVARPILSSIAASAKLRATEQLIVRHQLDLLVKFVKGKYLGDCVDYAHEGD